MEYGTTPATERAAKPDSVFLKALPGAMRGFDDVIQYSPNQAFIGNIDPRHMPDRPWHSAKGPGAEALSGVLTASPFGKFGRILDEGRFYALVKFADIFDLVMLEREFALEAVKTLEEDNAMQGADLSRLRASVDAHAISGQIADGALPLVRDGRIVGCVKSAHPNDVNLGAHAMLENLSSKATAIYALRRLLTDNRLDPLGIDYIIETSEEACGDMNQRGGGNFAKAIGELAGLDNATGCDVRSFCAGPVHGLLQAASLIRAGSVCRVAIVAGGTMAKLAMNAKKHIEKGFPVLEDCLGSFAIMVEGDPADGLLVRNDVAGMLRIGSGSSPQAVMQDLVAGPLSRAGLRFSDIDRYAPELQNPEITEAAGAGNVTLANLKMIAAMAVMKKEIEKQDMDSFVAAHGVSGWAPTQGHIPSGIPALGWFLAWAREGGFRRGLVIGKGSLFLGRMTGLFDGVSLIVEAWKRDAAQKETGGQESRKTAAKLRIGLTIPGSESGAEELIRGAAEAAALDPSLEPVLFGGQGGSAEQAHRDMENALSGGAVQGAVTFHYPFPIGISTVGLLKAPGNGRDLFVSATTGASSADRVEALVKNAISGIAAAKAYGIPHPRVGFLNLDGAARALAVMRDLGTNGYGVNLVSSARGDALLRGNDILAGTVDVLVCDSLTGNTVIKLLSALTTGGWIEVSGSGYGPGVGRGAPAVGIISRATAAPVVANALALMAKMIRGGLAGVYESEISGAEKAGLDGLLAARVRGSSETGAPAASEPAASGPARKVVHHEIEGVDALEMEAAVKLLLHDGVYCEPAMGCAGPVVLVAAEDAEGALARLKDARFL
jgi:betaine reductase